MIFLYYLIPVFSLPLFAWYFLHYRNQKNALIGMVFFLWGLFSLPKGVGRSDLAHLAVSVAPFCIFYLIMFAEMKRDNNNSKTLFMDENNGLGQSC